MLSLVFSISSLAKTTVLYMLVTCIMPIGLVILVNYVVIHQIVRQSLSVLPICIFDKLEEVYLLVLVISNRTVTTLKLH